MRTIVREQCSNCDNLARVVVGDYEFEEMGLPVVLEHIEIVRCEHCGNIEPIIPDMNDLMSTIALVVICKPCKLDGREIKFLRTYVGKGSAEFAKLLHLDKTTMSKMENDEDRGIGPQTDKLIRFVVTALSPELHDKVNQLLEQLPDMEDCEKIHGGILFNPETRHCQYA